MFLGFVDEMGMRWDGMGDTWLTEPSILFSFLFPAGVEYSE